MKFDKPQKGNPHGIAVNQHFFPKKCIARFCNDSGFVQVNNLIANKVLPAKPDDQIFCAKRVWDQRAESGYMKLIEDEFQEIANKVLEDPISIRFSESDKMWINRFYALWTLRHYYSENPQKDEKSNSSSGGLTDDEQEQLEKVGATFVSNNGFFLGRHFAGSMIQTQIGDIVKQIMDSQWGVLRSNNIEFVVPDCTVNILAIPINPSHCLYSKTKNLVATDCEVNFINSNFINSSKRYFFARDLSKC